MRVPYAPPGERLLKRSSAARIAGISGVRLWAMVKRGEIATHPAPGGHRLYRAADVLALRDRLDALEREGPAVNDETPVPGHDTIHAAVISDIRERQEKGEREYGRKHRLHNGLDGLTEAYEEALDMAFWLRQEIEERKLCRCREQEAPQ